ncbi:MAG: sensor histidine kinase [Clostridia bacterium]|nr:sensor histidine kinase [Clostridia bacterium]
MKFREYIRNTKLIWLSQLLVLILIDALLYVSTAINKSLKDILYLNVMLVTIFLVFFLYGYISVRTKYSKLRQTLSERRSIDYLLPEDSSFFSHLLRDTVELKNSECHELVERYKNDLDELRNYITRWVHEVKIPISVTELMVENNDELSTEQSHRFKTELERLKFLVNQVLYAGRAAYYQEDLSVHEFSIKKVVKEAIRINSYFLVNKNIEVEVSNLDYHVVSDEKWVVYILEQILNNASKYVEQDGSIMIHAEERTKAICLSIRDNGLGIPAADLPRIFDRGFTGENGRKTTKSTGMGLYYSKKIADKLGIGLEAQSKEGAYTEFRLTFQKINDYLNVTKL